MSGSRGVDQRRHQRERGDLLVLGLERELDEPVDLAARESVETISELARAICSKLRSATCGLIWWSIAFMTHFWRAIRE